MNLLYFFSLLIGCIFTNYAQNLIDLEDFTQDFIIQTKQLKIPGYEGAFNPSIVRFNDIILMTFRVRDEQLISNFKIGIVVLDQDFNYVSEPQILNIDQRNLTSYGQNQDPRLIVVHKKLYFLYSNFIKVQGTITRRMFLAPLTCEQGTFTVGQPLCLRPFQGETKRWEKNWIPFEYKDELFVAHSIVPHYILKPSLISGTCVMADKTYSDITWQWGELRGGTPALCLGNEYIAFFHSNKMIKTKQSDGKIMHHYMIGAYTFSSEPPFTIKKISPMPIVDKSFYSGTMYDTWKPLRVVFPMGIIVDDEYIWISYGRQDFEMWVAKIDKRKLLASLIDSPSLSQEEIITLETQSILMQSVDSVQELSDAPQDNS